MPVDEQLASRIVALLEELIEIDPEGMTALFNARVPCSEALADHPTVQVGCRGARCELGVIGVLNGLAGAFDSGDRQGWGAVAVTFDDSLQQATGAELLTSADKED